MPIRLSLQPVPAAFVPRPRIWPGTGPRRGQLRCFLRYDRHLQRQDLASLDARLRGDIGRSSEEIRRECAKPCWRR